MAITEPQWADYQDQPNGKENYDEAMKWYNSIPQSPAETNLSRGGINDNEYWDNVPKAAEYATVNDYDLAYRYYWANKYPDAAATMPEYRDLVGHGDQAPQTVYKSADRYTEQDKNSKYIAGYPQSDPALSTLPTGQKIITCTKNTAATTEVTGGTPISPLGVFTNIRDEAQYSEGSDNDPEWLEQPHRHDWPEDTIDNPLGDTYYYEQWQNAYRYWMANHYPDMDNGLGSWYDPEHTSVYYDPSNPITPDARWLAEHPGWDPQRITTNPGAGSGIGGGGSGGTAGSAIGDEITISIDGNSTFSFEVVDVVDLTEENIVPEHSVEEQFIVHDHIIAKPKRVKLTCKLPKTLSVNSIPGGSSSITYIIPQKLSELNKKREPVKLRSSLVSVDSMAIVHIAYRDSADSDNFLMAEMELTEIRKVSMSVTASSLSGITLKNDNTTATIAKLMNAAQTMQDWAVFAFDAQETINFDSPKLNLNINTFPKWTVWGDPDQLKDANSQNAPVIISPNILQTTSTTSPAATQSTLAAYATVKRDNATVSWSQ